MAAHEIFVCYSSKDEARARELLDFLEARGFRAWISSRNVQPGHNYQESIVAAIRSARIVVFILSEFSNKTGEVKKELSLASSFDVPVIPVRLSATTPNAALLYELATRQWIDAFPDFEQAMEKVAAAVEGTLRGADADDAPEVRPAPARQSAPAPAMAAERPPIVAPGSEQFEAIRALLAQQVGPIAKVLVQKAATGAASAEEFYAQLAAHIRAPEQREAFLRKARARLSGGS
jgi:TIR domain